VEAAEQQRKHKHKHTSLRFALELPLRADVANQQERRLTHDDTGNAFTHSPHRAPHTEA
jgi:hypothetical protein